MPTKIETESILSLNDGEHYAQISTRQRTMKTRMRKLGVEVHHKQADYACYRIPKKWIRISPPRRVSEKQRQAARQRLLKSPISPNSLT